MTGQPKQTNGAGGPSAPTAGSAWASAVAGCSPSPRPRCTRTSTSCATSSETAAAERDHAAGPGVQPGRGHPDQLLAPADRGPAQLAGRQQHHVRAPPAAGRCRSRTTARRPARARRTSGSRPSAARAPRRGVRRPGRPARTPRPRSRRPRRAPGHPRPGARRGPHLGLRPGDAGPGDEARAPGAQRRRTPGQPRRGRLRDRDRAPVQPGQQRPRRPGQHAGRGQHDVAVAERRQRAGRPGASARSPSRAAQLLAHRHRHRRGQLGRRHVEVRQQPAEQRRRGGRRGAEVVAGRARVGDDQRRPPGPR